MSQPKENVEEKSIGHAGYSSEMAVEAMRVCKSKQAVYVRTLDWRLPRATVVGLTDDSGASAKTQFDESLKSDFFIEQRDKRLYGRSIETRSGDDEVVPLFLIG